MSKESEEAYYKNLEAQAAKVVEKGHEVREPEATLGAPIVMQEEQAKRFLELSDYRLARVNERLVALKQKAFEEKVPLDTVGFVESLVRARALLDSQKPKGPDGKAGSVFDQEGVDARLGALERELKGMEDLL